MGASNALRQQQQPATRPEESFPCRLQAVSANQQASPDVRCGRNNEGPPPRAKRARALTSHAPTEPCACVRARAWRGSRIKINKPQGSTTSPSQRISANRCRERSTLPCPVLHRANETLVETGRRPGPAWLGSKSTCHVMTKGSSRRRPVGMQVIRSVATVARAAALVLRSREEGRVLLGPSRRGL